MVRTLSPRPNPPPRSLTDVARSRSINFCEPASIDSPTGQDKPLTQTKYCRIGRADQFSNGYILSNGGIEDRGRHPHAGAIHVHGPAHSSGGYSPESRGMSVQMFWVFSKQTRRVIGWWSLCADGGEDVIDRKGSHPAGLNRTRLDTSQGSLPPASFK